MGSLSFPASVARSPERRAARTMGIGLVSAASMVFELSLTRYFAVAEWYHFGFLSVSVALMGYGLSGTLLAIGPRRLPSCESLGAALAVAILGAYGVINTLPFDSYQLALDPRQWLYLPVYYLSLVVPFALAGLIVASELAARPEAAHSLYAANLIGSAVGGASLLLLLPSLGAPRAIVAAALIATLGSLALSAAMPGTAAHLRGARRAIAVARPLLLLEAAGCALVLVVNPTWLTLRLSPYKDLSYALQPADARLGYQAWNVHSRVDVVESPQIHVAPGLSLHYAGRLPPQHGMTIDGGDLSPLSRRTEPGDGDYLAYLPASLAYRLRPGAHAMILRPRGGTDVATALHMGAVQVLAVEDNALVVHVVGQVYGEHVGHLYDDPRVTVSVEEPRAALERSLGGLDIIHLSLAEGFHPLTSGAYSLAENHLYTVEAFASALQRLDRHGMLIVTRWLQDPPSESVRAAGTVVAALERVGVVDPSRHLIAYRSWSTMTLLASPSPFTADDIAQVVAACDALGYDPVFYEGISPEEANRHNVLPEDGYYAAFQSLLHGDRQAFYRAQVYDVSPPTDDRPFFGHYFRWQQVPQILAQMGRTWQPFAGSGYLLVLALLLLAIVAAVGLVALPVLLGKAGPRGLHGKGRVVAYFAGLGLGFMMVEVPLMQRLILYLGQPALSFIVVLSALLCFSGAGSTLAPRLPLRACLLALAGLIVSYPLILGRVEAATLAQPLAVRAAITAALLLPLGLLMGVPFAGGLGRVERWAPGLTPWVWAINGGASVISSILAMVVALATGYRAVLWLAAGCYLVAAAALWPVQSLPKSAAEGASDQDVLR